jgi:mannose-6-phosphate isomerase-like protein (cupin superfamily)
MDYKNKLGEVLSKINWITKLGIKDVEEVSIAEIPLKWSKFNGTEDEWVRLPFLEEELSVTACLYKAKAGKVFAPHFHNETNETIFVRKGSITIVTPKYTIELFKNQAHTIEKGLPHICFFSKIENSLIEITWCPPMKGWSGSFIND